MKNETLWVYMGSFADERDIDISDASRNPLCWWRPSIDILDVYPIGRNSHLFFFNTFSHSPSIHTPCLALTLTANFISIQLVEWKKANCLPISIARQLLYVLRAMPALMNLAKLYRQRKIQTKAIEKERTKERKRRTMHNIKLERCTPNDGIEEPFFNTQFN